MIHVINIRNAKKENFNIFIGRKSSYNPTSGMKDGTVLGNPFWMQNETERTKVIEQFKEYLTKNIETLLPYLKRIKEREKEYGNVYLVCFCKPKACHGDIIVDYIRNNLI